MLDLGRVQLLVPNQGGQTTWGSNNDMRASLLLGELLDIGRDGCSTVEDFGPDVGHELGESSELILDLVGELSCVTENDDGNFSINRFAGVSRVLTWQKIAYICCNEARTKTAVLPIPDLA